MVTADGGVFSGGRTLCSAMQDPFAPWLMDSSSRALRHALVARKERSADSPKPDAETRDSRTMGRTLGSTGPRVSAADLRF